MVNKQKIIIITVAIVLVVMAGVGFWFWSKNKQVSSTPSSQTQKAPTLGGKIFEKTQNPIKGQIPETNPFKEQKNPFDAIYKNPFE